MLNEKEFFDAMKEELSCLLGDSYKIKMDDCQNVFVKNMIQQKVYRFHGDELFKTYLNGVGMKEICRNVKDCIVMLEPLKEAKTLSFAEAQNHIFMKVINRERHKDIKELVFAKAWENMQRDYRMSIGSIEEAMQAVLLDMPFSGSSIEELELNDCSFHILTNEENKFGFTSVFYPDVLKKYGEKFGDFYIIPSSIHEALLFPEKKVPQNWNAKEFANNIRSINETEVAPEEVLSDSLYYYDATLHQVKIV